MKLVTVLFVSLSVLGLVSPSPATFDPNTRLWTVSDLLFALRYDITSPLIQVNLKSLEVQYLLGTLQRDASNLKAWTSSVKSLYIARGNGFTTDAYFYALQNRLTKVAGKLGPLNDLIQISSDDAQAISDAVGDEAVTVSNEVLNQTLTEVVRYNEVIDGILDSLENRTLENKEDATCINEGIYLVRDNTLEYYDKTMSCLRDETPTKKPYNQVESLFTHIETITTKAIKSCINNSLQKGFPNLKLTEDEAHQCLGKILELDGHDLIDAPAIIAKAHKDQSTVLTQIRSCTSELTSEYISNLESVLATVDSCLYGDKVSADVQFDSEPVTPQEEARFPYMFIDNLPIYSFNVKKEA